MNNKLFIIIINLVIILFIVASIVSRLKKQSDQKEIKPTITVHPTIFFPSSYPTKSAEYNILTPILTPADFTGVKEIEIPTNELDLAKEKQKLRRKLPIKESAFVINFDYNQDMFMVDLNEPKEENEKKLADWLTKNYPNIPFNKFIVR